MNALEKWKSGSIKKYRPHDLGRRSDHTCPGGPEPRRTCWLAVTALFLLVGYLLFCQGGASRRMKYKLGEGVSVGGEGVSVGAGEGVSVGTGDGVGVGGN